MKVAAVFSCLIIFTQGHRPFQIETRQGFPISTLQSNAITPKASKAPLPRNNVMPKHYEVHLTPVIDGGVEGHDQYTIPGKITIEVVPVVDTETITLNALDLIIDETSLRLTPVNPDDPAEFTVTGRNEEENEFYILTVTPQIRAGESYLIEIVFTSYIATDKLNGIYLTGYIDPTTQEFANVLTTQFEASAARQAFPCLDEPWVKATFKFFIGYDSTKYIALCNSNDLTEIDHPTFPAGWKLKEFENTVEMSTYLVAILVADYTSTEAPPEIFNKPVKVYGPPHLMEAPLNGGTYGATKAAQFLAHFESYFGIDYKMPKMDSVAVPAFWFGAMENWGLNFYRETILMYYQSISSEAEREVTTAVLAHELVHQWFGNLVTAEFWSQIWLNEGFATFFSPLATVAVTPEYDALSLRQYDIAQRALAFDATSESHPLINSAHGNQSYDTLMEVFDRITYEKAGSLIRMMEAFLTPATMKQGLIDYLTELSFGGANQDDLFRILTERAHDDGTLPADVNVKQIMDTWSHQSGFPLVRVTKSNERIYVSQERFSEWVQFTDGTDLDPNDLWEIPVAVATAENPDFVDLRPDFWIAKDVAVKILDEYDTSRWIIINPDGIGYFRTLYDIPLLNLIVDQLVQDGSVISAVTKSQLFDDYFTFVQEKFTAIENALILTKYLGQEVNAGVWVTALSHMGGYYRKLSGTVAQTEFEGYFVPKLEQALNLIGIEQLPQDKGTVVTLRAQLLDWACALGMPACLEYATREFPKWESSPYANPIPVDIRSVMYCGAVKHGAVSTFDEALNRYKGAETSVKDKPLFLSALACSATQEQPITILENLLETSSDIAPADKITFLQHLGASSITRVATTEYIAEFAPEVINTLGPEAISRYIGTLASYVGTTQELQQLEEIVSSHSEELESVLDTVDSYFDIVRSNIQWRRENEERLQIWFSEN